MKKNSPRKKNVSKKRNTSKKNSYPEKNYITENKTTQNTSKKKYYKKKKNKVTLKEYIREIVEYVWDDRVTIIFCAGFLAALGFLYFTTHYNPNNDSEICTIESVEIIEHEDPYSISGEFETEECGIITSSKSPNGIPIRKYLQNFETGKKYRAYKTFYTRNDEFDFSVLRFEEIKE
ncbi:hypothetical protein [uncultured Rothia sp.]|uniref:hypothetical protein n=1 Tax=uncultured Rothia sp. TaxID=316088 RepID=UPI00262D6E76|nr:hypothetical protein [uncultured Rothia sp.]